MDKKQTGSMLTLATITADQIAAMPGGRAVPAKAPIMGMIIQNLHEALLAFEKGVDVTGIPISPKQIGDGLNGMLDHLRDEAKWKKLQEGLDTVGVNATVKLTGMIRAAANALADTP